MGTEYRLPYNDRMHLRFYLFLIVLVFAPLSAEAKEKSIPHPEALRLVIPAVPPVVATYDIYVGGAHLITADIHFQEDSGHYHARLTAHTRGIWYKFFPWDSELLARGNIVGEHLLPAEYATHDVWGKKIKTAHIHFAKNGLVTTEFDPPQHDENRIRPRTSKSAARSILSRLCCKCWRIWRLPETATSPCQCLMENCVSM